jgi:hypothetical protein
MAKISEATYKHILTHLPTLSVDIETGTVGRPTTVNKRTGYVSVYVGGKTVYLHHVVAVAGGLDIRGKVINHLDTDKQNNAFSNLELTNDSENRKHALRNIEMKPYSPKLTEEEVFDILKLKERGFSSYDIAEMYGGRSPRQIRKVLSGDTYKDAFAKYKTIGGK